MMKPEYLGDGAYVQPHPHDPMSVILTTGSHLLPEADNTIYLEMSCIDGLIRYLTEFKKLIGQ